MKSSRSKRGQAIEEALETALLAEEERELRSLLLNVTAAERKKCAAVLRSWATKTPAEIREGLGARGPHRVALVSLATLPIAELRSVPIVEDDAPLVEIAAARPDLEALVRHLCCATSSWNWRLGWRLIVEKDAPRPEDDRFWQRLVDCLLQGARAAGMSSGNGPAQGAPRLALDVLETQVPYLRRVLEQEILETLRRPVALGADLGGDAPRRIKDFIELMRLLYLQGELPRGELFGAILDGLAAGGSPLRDAALLELYRHLSPTPEELRAFAPRFLGLLRAKHPSTAAYALETLAALPLADRPRELLAELGPILGGRLKAAALTALGLLDAAAERDPEALSLVAQALAHENAAVQGAALAILERHPTRAAEQAAVARPFRDRLGTSLADRLDRLLGPPGEARVGLPSETVAPPRAPSLLSPVADHDELLLLTMDLLVGGPASLDPLEVERALDGISRLCGDACSPARVAPILQALEGGRRLSGVQRCVARAVEAWLTEGEIHPGYGFSIVDFFRHRAVAVARRARARRPAPLLALPTDRSGLLEPGALVVRARAWQSLGLEPDHLDAAQALLRLSDAGRSAALGEARSLGGELGAVIRYALGAEEAVGPTAALWIAAARARAPGDDAPEVEARHPGSGPDGGSAARFQSTGGALFRLWAGAAEAIGENQSLLRLPRAPQHVWDLPSVALHYDHCGLDEGAIRASALVRPGHLEPFFASGVRAMTLANQARPERAYLEPLLSWPTTLGPAARHLLLVGLASQEPSKRLIAVEAMAKAVSEGRLDAAALAESIGARLFDRKLAGRWTKAFAEVARTSPAHRAFIARLNSVLPPRDDGAQVFAALA